MPQASRKKQGHYYGEQMYDMVWKRKRDRIVRVDRGISEEVKEVRSKCIWCAQNVNN